MTFISRAILRLLGWRVDANLPAARKYVVIGTFHTTNWDFPLMLLLKSAIGLKVRWVGKHSLFRWPLGWLMRRLGGIPVDRRFPHNYVEQIVDAFRRRVELILVIAPEGTRKKAQYWKSGFYFIALGAGVPIALGFADYARKVGGIGPSFVPTGDVEADMARIRAFYADKRGLHPEKQSEIRFRPSAEPPRAVE